LTRWRASLNPRTGTPPIAAKDLPATAAGPADIFGVEKWQAMMTCRLMTWRLTNLAFDGLAFFRERHAWSPRSHDHYFCRRAQFFSIAHLPGVSNAAAVTCIGLTNGLRFELSASICINREWRSVGTSVAYNWFDWGLHRPGSAFENAD
jgi:hypothetical protein